MPVRHNPSDFLVQHDVKEMTCRKPTINYPMKLCRYWIAGEMVQHEGHSNPNTKIAEIGIDRGQMKRWMNNLEFSNYDTWDGYDVILRDELANVGYSLLTQGDATENTWQPATRYDAVITLHFLEHLHDPESFIQKLDASIEPGGCLIGGMPVTPEFARYGWEKKIRKKARQFGHVSVFSPERIITMADALGYSVEVLTGAFFLRLSDKNIENSVTWLKFNRWFGKTFPSLGGEIYFKLRKPA